MDLLVIRNGTNTTADVNGTISTCQNVSKTRDLPVGPGRRDQVKLRSHAGTPNMPGINAHGDAVHAKMAGGTQRYVSIRPIDPELPDPPTGSLADLPDGLGSHENTTHRTCADTRMAMWMARIVLKIHQ